MFKPCSYKSVCKWWHVIAVQCGVMHTKQTIRNIPLSTDLLGVEERPSILRDPDIIGQGTPSASVKEQLELMSSESNIIVGQNSEPGKDVNSTNHQRMQKRVLAANRRLNL